MYIMHSGNKHNYNLHISIYSYFCNDYLQLSIFLFITKANHNNVHILDINLNILKTKNTFKDPYQFKRLMDLSQKYLYWKSSL